MTPPVEKISRVVFTPVRGCVLKMNVKLYSKGRDGKNESYHQQYLYNDRTYLTLNPSAFLTLQLVSDEWSKDKAILINQHSIFSIINAFNRLKHAIYHHGIFAVKENQDIVIYADKAEEHKETINHIGNNQFLVAKAAIVYDDNEVSYEGVRLFINNSENTVDLPIDAFEALLYVLTKIDIYEYSQQMLNYYVASQNGAPATPPPSNRGSSFIHKRADPTTTESVQSNLTSKPKTLFDIKK